jgi:hypothetical protein
MTFSAAAGLDSASLHRPSGQAEIAGGVLVEWQSYRAQLELFASSFFPNRTVWLPASRQETPGVPEGGRFTLLSAGARACALRSFGQLEIGPCAGGEAESIHAVTFGAASNPGGHGLWLTRLGGGMIDVALGSSVWIGLDCMLAVPSRPPAFTITLPPDEHADVLSREAISVRTLVRLGFRFF